MQNKKTFHKIVHVVSLLASLLLRRQSLLLGAGILFGLTSIIWLSQFLVMFGSSLSLRTGMFLGIAITFELARSQPKENQTGSRIFSVPVAWLLVAVWTVAFPWLLSWGTSFITVFPIADLSSIFVQTCIALILTLLMFSFPLFVVTKQVCQSRIISSYRYSFFFILAGVGLGVLLGAVGLAPLWGLRVSGIIVATIAAILGVIHFLKPAVLFKKSSSTNGNIHSLSFFPSNKEQGVAIVLFGMMFALLLRVSSQLYVGTFVVSVFHWSALLIGGATGFWWGARSVRKYISQTYVVSSLLLFASAWSVAVLFLFPQLTNTVLQVKAAIPSVGLVQMISFLITCFILLPLGFVWGTLSVQTSRPPQSESSSSQQEITTRWFLPHLLAFMTGYLVASWSVIASHHVASWLVAITFVSILFPCWHFVSSFLKKELRATTGTRYALIAIFLCFVFSGPLIVSRYQPSRASRLLFGTDILYAVQQEIDFKLLPFTNEGRLIDQIEGTQGTYTLWQYRGEQIQIRENGIPMTSVSTNPQICPQTSTDVMQVMLPWMLHENPQSILLLGLQGGTTVQTSLALPFKEVVCVEEEKALQELIHRNIWSRSKIDPLQEKRFRFLTINPALAVCSQRQKYDLIVSSPNQTSLLQSTSCLTEEFYNHAAGQLTEEGIFCQRFERRDYGPQPLLSLLKTMQLVFNDVMLIETGTAEMILLGTRSEKGLKRSRLVKRLQAPSVRELLGQLGWDWSFPLNLRAFDDEAVTRLLNKADAPVNTVANNWLTFQLPVEMMRWTKGVSKATEFEKLVAGETGQLLKWSVKKSEERDILDRLADVAGGQKLMANYPDHWFAYRDVVKKQIQTNPRPTIQLVRGEGLKRKMHPVLRRRLDFLKTLGKAKKKSKPTLDDLAKIEQFESPYDPLISPFYYFELVEFMPRVKNVDPHVELSYRLHTIYYAHAADRSIRNVVDGIHFLVDHPQLMGNRTTQIELDGLLQVLKRRWALRGTVSPLETEVVMQDIQKTLQATEFAFAEIERLEKTTRTNKQPHLQTSNWKLRKLYITRTLVRPLRTYEDQLLSHYQAEQHKKKKKRTKRTKKKKQSKTNNAS